jgi:hypothetical protein
MRNRQQGTISNRDGGWKREGLRASEITRRRRHVRGGARVEVPVGGARRSVGVDADGLQSGSESAVIPDAGR